MGAGGEFDVGPSANPGVVNLTWDYEEAESYLASLEPIGWRLGLDRIRRLTSALGMPQHRFASVHVVGTNGKSSVTQMTAALLNAHGVSAGAYLSPHVRQWSERIRIRGAEIGNDDLAAAIERTAQSAEAVNRALDEGDAVTQFEGGLLCKGAEHEFTGHCLAEDEHVYGPQYQTKRLARARASDDQQWPIAMADDGALRLIQGGIGVQKGESDTHNRPSWRKLKA